jgi:hypothetical protein
LKSLIYYSPWRLEVAATRPVCVVANYIRPKLFKHPLRGLGSFVMIILDTHILVWWVQNDSRLTKQQRQWLKDYESDGLGISILFCWEVAKLVEKKRLILPLAIDKWLVPQGGIKN